uniref:Uncharacterized protein n=1 Tax=Heterorhabditis bacteriophora TaxID=37862 RepID=A0A1I7XMS7_HETBA
MLNNIKYSKSFKKKCGKELSEITTDEALVTNSTSLNETRQDLDSYAITKYGTNNLRQITSAYKFEKNGMGINRQHKHGVFEAATSKTIIFGEKSKQLNNNMRIEEPESTTTIQERENSSLINESNVSNDMQLSMYSEKNNESLLLTTSEPNVDSLESSNSHK